MSKNRLNRRDFLKLAGAATAGLALTACGVKATDLPTTTTVPTANPSATPILPTTTTTPTVAPSPTLEVKLVDLPQTKAAVDQFAAAMKSAGVQADSDQIRLGLTTKEITGKDGKKYEIASSHIDPDLKKQGEALEGNYPLMIKTDGGWWKATLENLSMIRGWHFGAMLNLNKDFHDITLDNFGTGYAFNYWDIVHAEKSSWDFSDPDYNIRTAHDQGIDVLSGILWGKSVPDWVKQLPEAELRSEMIEYIQQVMKHNKGQVERWIVYNEANYHSGKDVYWNNLGGVEVVRLAFSTARQTDSNGKLIYSDYTNFDGASSPWDKDRLAVMETVISQLKADGSIDGIALQVTSRMSDFDPNKLRKTLDILSKYDLPIHITEFSILINGENTPANLVKQNEVAEEAIEIFKEYPLVTEVIAFPLEDRLANTMYTPNANSGLWLKTDSGYIPKPIVFGMMKGLVEEPINY